MTDRPRFPLWYYGGPFLRIQDPDADLPRRKSSTVPRETLERIEFTGVVNGERLVAPFHDSNSLDEMLGALFLAAGYPESWHEDERYVFPTIQGSLAEVVLRIKTKLARNPGQIRANWFALALEHVREASKLFAARDYAGARERVWQAHDSLQQGNKASRRKATFVVDPSGTAKKV